jgi:hypothetical protein
MKTLVAILLLVLFCGYAYSEDITYYPPQFKGDTGTIRGPGGDMTYTPPVFKGDYGTITGPGNVRYDVLPPMYPGDQTTIRKW